MKTLMIILDGLAGKTGELTELEMARKGNLDSLASDSMCGLMQVVPGIAPESDAAVMSLLGYSGKSYTGRGPLEAVGAGLNFKDGELALRCNFSTSFDGKKIADRRAGRTLTDAEAKELEKIILKNVKLTNATFSFKATSQHRCVLVIKSKKKLSSDIMNTDPAYRRLEGGYVEALKAFPMVVQECKAVSAAAAESARLVNEFTQKSFEVLNNCAVNKKRAKKKQLQANIILCRDAGDAVPRMVPLSKKYKKKFAIIADMPLEIGIGKLAGMSVTHLEPSISRQSYSERVSETLKALKKNDVVYIHIKGPDLFGHDGDSKGKIKSIEDIDKYFIGPVMKKLGKETVVTVTADHATPCSMKAHSSDPVPVLFYHPALHVAMCDAFDEKCCATGFELTGLQFMDFLMNLSK